MTTTTITLLLLLFSDITTTTTTTTTSVAATTITTTKHTGHWDFSCCRLKGLKLVLTKVPGTSTTLLSALYDIVQNTVAYRVAFYSVFRQQCPNKLWFDLIHSFISASLNSAVCYSNRWVEMHAGGGASETNGWIGTKRCWCQTTAY